MYFTGELLALGGELIAEVEGEYDDSHVSGMQFRREGRLLVTPIALKNAGNPRSMMLRTGDGESMAITLMFPDQGAGWTPVWVNFIAQPTR